MVDAAAVLTDLCKVKGLTPRARRTFFRCCPRRARSDDFHESRSSGKPRLIALGRLADSFSEELDEPAQAPEEFWENSEPFYPQFIIRTDAKEYEEQRRHEDAAEVAEQSFASLNRIRVEHKRRVLASAITPDREVEASLRLIDLELAGQYAA